MGVCVCCGKRLECYWGVLELAGIGRLVYFLRVCSQIAGRSSGLKSNVLKPLAGGAMRAPEWAEITQQQTPTASLSHQTTADELSMDVGIKKKKREREREKEGKKSCVCSNHIMQR